MGTAAVFQDAGSRHICRSWISVGLGKLKDAAGAQLSPRVLGSWADGGACFNVGHRPSGVLLEELWSTLEGILLLRRQLPRLFLIVAKTNVGSQGSSAAKHTHLLVATVLGLVERVNGSEKSAHNTIGFRWQIIRPVQG